ncbi:F5/8 type C domain-containing protein [Sphingomonas palmae]|uniref:F5/8 type C domain-containing protein n=1 Tax=Sphingomonas palmae TaxID=1855283 RepID=A0A1H7V1A3_9SPHN|nr:discoidin domain-containing protein [Sphingomonas palmae]SEM02698.1 F5/8 type C domain-containing protein [Sphingomonas palmae]
MIAAALLATAAVVAAPAPVRVLDRFDSVAAWQSSASDGVTARVSADAGALRLDYDFARVSGYAVARRPLVIDWPANFVLTLRVRGTANVTDLQIKFSDASGYNVWWVPYPSFRPSAEWQTLRIRPRDVEFAWGPSADKALRRTAAVEVVVVRGRDGGAGHVEVDDLQLQLLLPPAPPAAPVASDRRALDGRQGTAADLARPLVIDLGAVREIGGLTLHWGKRYAARYRVDTSDDRRVWRTIRRVDQGDGGDDPLPLPGTETRYLRLTADKGAKVELAEVEVMPRAWSATPNATIAALARAAPRGAYPRGFTEQSYWTLVASDGGAVSGLIGEDGAIEVAKGAFSIEPFVVDGARTVGWADVRATQRLEDGYLPLPHVAWAGDGWTLDTALVADQATLRLLARYRLTNTGTSPRTLTLALAVRPFQVNPPAQFLSQQGGVSPIERIAWNGSALAVTSAPAIAGDAAVTRRVTPLTRPDAVVARPFDQGALATPAAATGTASVTDPALLASGTMRWTVTLAPGASADVPLAIDDAAPADRTAFDRAITQTAAYWRNTLGNVTITVPPAKQAVADTIRTALAHVLMSRDGAAFKPGTRSYDRSWIRDGAMMGDTLLRLGHAAPVRAFADWYGTKLFDNGKVPCCVDARGPDPVPENDSQGEYIHLVTQLYRYTGDRAALQRNWPRLDAARRYMEAQRQSERTPANLTPERRMLYGLLPPSISHEGYSAKPQYSLWDDFWGLTGYKDAAYAARVLGRAEAGTIAAQRDQFAGDIHAAIDAAARHWRIDYIPGATSMGDFDATSTTMALDPAGEQDRLNPQLLRRTFERQYDRVMTRGAPGATWSDYTPYELRNVSALVRLGEGGHANDLLDAYMADRRPAAWNGWAEVVGRRPREIRFIGDMPHAWVASDFIRSALDLFAYEDVGRDKLVLAAGLTPDWLAGPGVEVRSLRTRYGTVNLRMRADAGGLVATISGDAAPPGGFVLTWPLAGKPGAATVNGRRLVACDGVVHLLAGTSTIVWPVS